MPAFGIFQRPDHAGEHGRGHLQAGGVLVGRELAGLLQRQPRAVPVGVLVVAVEQHAEFVDAVDQFVLVEHVVHRLRLAAGAEHLVQRQHRVVARVIGIVAGRAVVHLAVLAAHGEVVGDRDRLVVGDEEAVLRRRASGTRCARACWRRAARDRSPPCEPFLCFLAFFGIHFSCVPQPSSAGCRPSEMKPSTDQVFQNTLSGFGLLGALRVALGDVDALDADLLHQLRPAFAVVLRRLLEVEAEIARRG